jgi:putative transposase
MDDYNKGSHSVYKLTYHIIFVTKYRKKVITDEIGDFMKDMAEYLCNYRVRIHGDSQVLY